MIKVGDKVRRKKDFLDGNWQAATNDLGILPDDILVVNVFLGHNNHLVNFTTPVETGGWEISRFELIPPAKPIKEWL